MKKRGIAIILTLVLAALTGCSGTEGNGVSAEGQQEARFNYGLENVSAFAVDTEGMVYAAVQGKGEAAKYDSQGALLDTYDLGEGEHTSLCLWGSCLYAFTFGSSGFEIREYDFQKQTMVSYPLSGCPSPAKAMCVTDTDYYLIVYDEMAETEAFEPYDENDGYYSMGEIVLRVSRDGSSMEAVDIPHVITMNSRDEDTLCFYAYDGDGGYYFQDYDWRENTFGEKIYNNQFGHIFSFALYQEQAIVSSSTDLMLCVAAITDESVRADFGAGIFAYTGNTLQTAGDNCYVLNSLNGSIERLNLSTSVMRNEPIVCYAPEMYLTVPYGCGYQIEASQLTDDEFALTVLAGNSDYDICMMDTGQTFSRNMRDQGAYYPLNDVPGVQEYLDSCHDYIREAATDESGRIWMIPVQVEVPCFLYREENCQEIGIDFSTMKTYEDVLRFMETAYEKESCREWYGIGGYWHQGLLAQYIAGYGMTEGTASFDTELFRKVCGFLKELDYNGESMNLFMKSSSEVGSMEEYYGKYLFEYDSTCTYTEQEEMRFQLLSAAPLPQIMEGGDCPSTARCIYFSVNQNSANLENTLQYVSAFCEYMVQRKDTCMQKDMENWLFPDSGLTEDLYQIYADSEIYFELSDEMFWEDYQRYMQGEITLDAFITEVERKVDMYLNE